MNKLLEDLTQAVHSAEFTVNHLEEALRPTEVPAGTRYILARLLNAARELRSDLTEYHAAMEHDAKAPTPTSGWAWDANANALAALNDRRRGNEDDPAPSYTDLLNLLRRVHNILRGVPEAAANAHDDLVAIAGEMFCEYISVFDHGDKMWQCPHCTRWGDDPKQLAHTDDCIVTRARAALARAEEPSE